MTLYEKIKILYPDLPDSEFYLASGTIVLQNDSDDRGDYIREWNYPTLPKPTDEQLSGIK